MAQSKHEFFHKGVSEQKIPDIVVDLRRKDVDQISKWTPKEKKEAKEWLSICERTFNIFKNEILLGLK